MARLVVSAAVGVAVGWVTGNPQAGFAAFSATYGVTGFLDPAQKSRGPRLDDIKAPQASYGAPIPYLEGTNRVPGVFIWASDKREIATTEEVGGKGGPSAESTTYTYEIDVLYMVSANPIAGVRRIWSNGKLVWSIADDADEETLAASAETEAWTSITVYTGAADQLPDPIYEAAVGVGNAPAYRGRGTVMIEGLQLGGSGQLPVLTFEVVTNGEAGSVSSLLLDVPFGATLEVDQSQYGEVPSNTPSSEVTIAANGITIEEVNGVSGDGFLAYGPAPQYQFEAGKTYTVSADAAVVSRRGAPDPLTIIYFYTGGNQGSARWMWRPGTGTRISLGINSGSLYVADFPDAPESGNYRIVVALDAEDFSTVYQFYIDDVLYDTVEVAFQPIGVSNEFRFGGGTGGNSTDVIGRIDNFRVYEGLGFDSDTLTSEPVALDGVVSRACLRTGLLTAGDIDVTALASKTVRGMAVSQVTTSRAVLENLMRGYHFECVEGEKLKFVLLGGASALTVPYDDLGCYIDGEPPEPLPLVRRNDIEQPSRVTIKFANALNDYQDGAESSERIVTDSTAEEVIELPIVFSPEEAKRIADVRAMEIAVSNLGLGQINLDNRYAKLEPTDVVLLTGETGSTYRARIVKTSDAAGLRTIDCVIDDATAINSEAVTDENYTSSTIVRLLGDTEVIPIDGPLLRDADDSPGFYAAFGAPASDRWPGAGFYESLDDVTYTKLFDVTGRARYGTATTALGAWTGGAKFDEVNTVRVSVNGTLSSVTRDDIINDKTVNAFAIGADGRWEVIQARTATLVSEGVYDLSGLLRGLRGTNHEAMSSHEIGDYVVKLQTAGMRSVDEQTSDIGLARYWKAVTFGKSLAGASSQQFTPDGVRLRPLSPHNLRVADGADGRVLTWDRRTRLDTRLFGSVPLGEESESYDVELTDADGDVVFSTTVTEPECGLSATSRLFGIGYAAHRVRQIGTEYVGISDAFAAPTIGRLVRVDGDGQPLGVMVLATPGIAFQATALVNNGDDIYVSVIQGASAAYVYRISRTDIVLGGVGVDAQATYTAPSAADPQGLAFDGTYLWVSNSYSGSIHKLNATTLIEIDSYPINDGIGAMFYESGSLWICDRANDEVIQWDIATETEVKRLAAPRFPRDVVVVNGLVFVAATGLLVLDAATGVQIASHSIGGSLDTFRQHIEFTGTEIVFADSVESQLVYLDATTGQESRRLPLADAYGVSGYGGGNLFASTRSGALGMTISTAAYGSVDIGSGYSATVYQNSAVVGRGYPATIEL